MKTPASDHPIDYAPATTRMRARVGTHILADSAEVVLLSEGSRPAVAYFPRADVETGFLSATAKVTHCPYKGDATHYTLMVDGALHENAAWSYEAPFASAEPISGLIAFYPEHVEVYSVSEEELAARRAD